MTTATTPPAAGVSAHADGAAYVDGEFCAIADARIPLVDLGFIRSDATYDVVHVWKGRFFRLDAHLDRFFASAERLRFTIPVSREELASILDRLVGLTGLADAYVNMTVSRGVLPPGTRDPLACRNRLYAFAIPFMWIAPPDVQPAGISMIVASPQRIPPASVDQSVKNYQWGDLTRAMFEARDRGAAVAVLLDGEGNVTEGAGFNVFALCGGRLRTPAAGVLPGVTRRTAIELAAAMGIATEAGPLPVDELRGADEIFITSTAGGIIPIATLDGAPVGSGTEGPVTAKLRERYWQAHADPAYTTPVTYGIKA